MKESKSNLPYEVLDNNAYLNIMSKNLSTRNNLVNLNNSNIEDKEIYVNHEHLLGKKFINNTLNNVHCSDVFKTPVICLFFSSIMCNPSHHFVKDLIELYNECNQGVKNLEIIQIPLEKERNLLEKDDKDKTEKFIENSTNLYKQYITDKPCKPWVFMPCFNNKIEELKIIYNIKSTPVLIVLDRKLQVLTFNGRQDIAEHGYTIGDEWLSKIKEDK